MLKNKSFPGASLFLVNNARFLTPGNGKTALDTNPRTGQDAIYLARLGFTVETLESNQAEGLALASLAEKAGVRLKIISMDSQKIQLSKDRYDLILSIQDINRNLIMQMKKALKPDGIIMMQSYTQKQLAFSPVDSRLILGPKELLFFFKDLRVLKYEETLEHGPAAFAGIVAQK